MLCKWVLRLPPQATAVSVSATTTDAESQSNREQPESYNVQSLDYASLFRYFVSACSQEKCTPSLRCPTKAKSLGRQKWARLCLCFSCDFVSSSFGATATICGRVDSVVSWRLECGIWSSPNTLWPFTNEYGSIPESQPSVLILTNYLKMIAQHQSTFQKTDARKIQFLSGIVQQSRISPNVSNPQISGAAATAGQCDRTLSLHNEDSTS